MTKRTTRTQCRGQRPPRPKLYFGSEDRIRWTRKEDRTRPRRNRERSRINWFSPGSPPPPKQERLDSHTTEGAGHRPCSGSDARPAPEDKPDEAASEPPGRGGALKATARRRTKAPVATGADGTRCEPWHGRECGARRGANAGAAAIPTKTTHPPSPGVASGWWKAVCAGRPLSRGDGPSLTSAAPRGAAYAVTPAVFEHPSPRRPLPRRSPPRRSPPRRSSPTRPPVR